jgi:sporulation protein YlmC with PRC-barrel domain
MQSRSGPPALYDDYPEQVTLRYVRDVQSKDVISTAQGTRLGRAGSIVVDTLAMTLEAIILKDTPQKATSVYAECVPLDDLRQIGDVVLVSDDAAVQKEPTMRGFLPVLGMNVKDAGGMYIGKVREVDFDPETGEINSLFYDEYGLNLPLSVFNLYGVSIEAVLKVRHCTTRV